MSGFVNTIFDPVKSPRIQREFDNDLPNSQDPKIKVLKAALPFISLHRPLGRATAAISSCSRLFFAFKEVELSYDKAGNLILSVAAVAGIVFQNKIGMAITTAHDIILNLKVIIGSDKEREDKLLEGLKLLNNAVYLTLLAYGSLELQIASLTTQTLLNSSTALADYREGRHFEAGASFLMAIIRLKQLGGYVELLKRKWKIEEAVRNVYVGEMKDKWNFPSDHLPIGVTVDGEFEVVSFNVMNNCYMEWVKDKNSQGLNGSLLTALDVPVNLEGLTKRDLLNIEMIKSMANKPKGGLIALQECGEPFLKELEKSLPEDWGLVRSFRSRMDQEVVLYNKKFFSFKDQKTPLDAYPSAPGRQLAEFSFTRNSDGKTVHMFNAHIPGAFDKPGPDEFAKYVQAASSKGEIVIAGGDCNFERLRMIRAFENAKLLDKRYAEQVLHTPYPTNIHPSGVTEAPGPLRSKGIDHLLVLGEISKTLKAHEIWNDERLIKTIKHLQGRG